MENATFTPTFGLDDKMMPFACEMSDVKILHWVVSSLSLSLFFIFYFLFFGVAFQQLKSLIIYFFRVWKSTSFVVSYSLLS